MHTERQAASLPVPLGPRTILVVDDNLELAENIAEILEVSGYHAMVAPSAERALEHIRSGGVAALITDYRLPGLSGAELIAEVRRAGHSMPVAVMSAYSDPMMIAQVEAEGAIDVLPKPVSYERLMDLVASLSAEPTDVLVVDDNRELAENFAELLRTRGLSPVITTSAREALQHRRRARVALVDYRLPDSAGTEVARRLLARNPSLRILFISAYYDEAHDRARAIPGAACMRKPADPAAILEWVSAAVAQDQGQAHVS